jgi:hypothetical protein
MANLIRQELGALVPGMSAEDAAEYWVRLGALKARVREALADGEAMLIEWFEANPGKALRVGDKLVLLGEKRYPAKPRDTVAALDAVLSAVHGDLEEFAELLAAGALKPGACKALLGEEFAAYFEERTAPAIKEGKRAPRGIVVIDTKYAELVSGD